MSIVRLPLCFECGVPHVPEDVAERVRAGENITIQIIAGSGVAANVLRWSTGALNIDAGRIGTTDSMASGRHVQKNRTYPSGYTDTHRTEYQQNTAGRWPANVILSHSLWCTDDACHESCPVRLLDAQSGNRPSNGTYTASLAKPAVTRKTAPGSFLFHMQEDNREAKNIYAGQQGGASRFFKTFAPDEATRMFYAPKASRKERGEGNTHPTVKNLALMKYLVQLVTPPGVVVLDPFAGSGTTLVACAQLGFACIGIEQDADYVAIAERRLAAA